MEHLYNHSNGVSFRRVDASDLEDLIALKNESWFGTHRVTFVSRASQERWLASLDAEDVHTPRNLVLVAMVNPECDIQAPIPRSPVGIFKILDVDWQSRRASVGWDVYKDYRGKGVGKRLVKAGVDFCFSVFGLHRLQADVLVDNLASHKCALAAGFKQEGWQTRAILRGGKWIDNAIYGILAE